MPSPPPPLQLGWHLAPPGRSTCNEGESVTDSECDVAGATLRASYGAFAFRPLQKMIRQECSGGDWDAVPRGCSLQVGGDWATHYHQVTDQRSCEAALHHSYQLVCSGARGFAPVPPLSVLANMNYYESRKSMNHCELVAKRTNLAFFIEQAIVNSNGRVFFHITYNGDDFRPVREFYRSIGLPAPQRATLFPALDHVLVQRGPPSPTDLCSRFWVLRAAFLNSRRRFSHYLFINDAVRGPFFEPSSVRLEPWALPPWLGPFLTNDPTIAAVGVSGSCQVSSHLQSWAIFFDSSVQDIFLHAYDESCRTGSKWSAIVIAEVGPYQKIFARGKAIKMLLPDVAHFGSREAASLAGKGWHRPPLWHKLRRCHTPFAGGQLFYRNLPPLENLVFVKSAGNKWRQGFFPYDYTNRIAQATLAVLGTQGCPHPRSRMANTLRAPASDVGSRRSYRDHLLQMRQGVNGSRSV